MIPGTYNVLTMGLDRTKIVEETFLSYVRNWKADLPQPHESIEGIKLPKQGWIDLFESQIRSRLLDLESRNLKNQNIGYYTIGSSGHEGNVVLGKILESTDPCFLHYRSGGFMMERGRKSGKDFVYETLLSFCASKEDPISGGRHKVWGSKDMWVPPQTSTIASHLPKAVGMAWAIEKAKLLRQPLPIPNQSIVFCSFGDASVNHATAVTAFNCAQWLTHQKIPVPILFGCEDNGIGISVRTPQGWIEKKFSHAPGIHYIQGNGLNLVDSVAKGFEAVRICRERRSPVFLHLKTVRLFGHAGSDVETSYLSQDEIEMLESKDPLITSSRILLSNGIMNSIEIEKMYVHNQKEISEKSKKAATRPKLSSATDVTASLFQHQPGNVLKNLKELSLKDDRKKIFGSDGASLPEDEKRPRHMAWLINAGLKDLLLKYSNMILFGEDVAKKGGVYHVTTDLLELFGGKRIFNTILDETTILGLAIGSAQAGFLPVPEIQYLAYYHNAEDQIRGEAGSMSFFSNGQYQNPMVIRVASFAYQKGFGGHFHNDNSVAALLDVPGVVIATPSRGDDAVTMMRTCMAHAKEEGRVIFFLEPIALYMKKDLYENGDGLWSFHYPSPETYTPMNEGKVYFEENHDMLIISFANGLHMSLQAAKILQTKYKIKARVFDLRWLKPLPLNHLESIAKGVKKILIVDESREFGGVGETLFVQLQKRLKDSSIKMEVMHSLDSYIPLGPAADKVLIQTENIVEKAISM